MAERPNYYILLDLDPSATDLAAISARIQDKQREWVKAKIMGSPKFRRKAEAYLELLDDITATMSDAALRAAEADAARQELADVQAAKRAELDDKIDILIARGGPVREDDLQNLVKLLGNAVSRAEVERRVREKGLEIAGVRPKLRPDKLRLDSTIAKKIRTSLRTTGAEDLYAFLGPGLGRMSASSVLRQRAREIFQDIIAGGSLDAVEKARKELAGLAAKVFESDEAAQRYENTRSWEALQGLEEHITLSATRNVLTADQLDKLVQTACERYQVDRDDALAFIDEYADKERIVILHDVRFAGSTPGRRRRGGAQAGTEASVVDHVAPRSIGVVFAGGGPDQVSNVIVAGQRLPAEAYLTFHAAPEHSSIRLRLVESASSLGFGELHPLDEDRRIGDAQLDFREPAGELAPVTVRFRLDVDGSLGIRARNASTREEVEAHMLLHGLFDRERREPTPEVADESEYYQLLDLDPDIDDPALIGAQITAKQREWARQKTMGSPRVRRRAEACLGLIEDMREKFLGAHRQGGTARTALETAGAGSGTRPHATSTPPEVWGIDLGTTYSSIARVDEYGDAVAIPNSLSSTRTPSVVWFEDANNVVVGDAARNAACLHPDRVVAAVRTILDAPNVLFEVDGEKYSPRDIASFVIRRLVMDAEVITGEKIKEIVLSCPAHFGAQGREALQEAGHLAGLDVVGVIADPVAAAVAYCMVQRGDSTALVYDLGGSSFGVTLVAIEDGKVRILGTGGAPELGGRNWNEAIASHFAACLSDETGTPVDDLLDDRDTYGELIEASERCKVALSATAKHSVPVRLGTKTFAVGMTRDLFEELTRDLLENTITLAEVVVREDSNLTADDIDRIVLVGGATYMPQVSRRLRERFGCEVDVFEPETAVAKGAALFGIARRVDLLALDAVRRRGGGEGP